MTAREIILATNAARDAVATIPATDLTVSKRAQALLALDSLLDDLALEAAIEAEKMRGAA